MSSKISLSSVLGRALRERCPHCGQGRMFTSYLRIVSACSVCGEKFGHIRADDGPAWITILLTGHIIVPLLVHIQSRVEWPMWQSMLIWITATTLLALALLPRSKSVFVSIIWYTKSPGSENRPTSL
ncbi:MAG: DUF983 domain-containing protein [Alphaproteobacteria bacterium]